MYLCMDTVSAKTYVLWWLCGFLIHLLKIIFLLFKVFSTLLLFDLIVLSIFLSISEPNCHDS